MSRYISNTIRQKVAKRAGYRCEYCLVPESVGLYQFHVDHIISLKHAGPTDLDNLAFACSICNRNKGSDLGTILERGSEIIPFFNPRNDIWQKHFLLDEEGEIKPLTSIGEATAKIFGLNHPDSILERRLLIAAGVLIIPE